jgi:NADH-quinone oxidoreductase subunit J
VNTIDILFYFFATLSIGGGLSMVCSKHPVSAAMFMIISLVGVAALFVLLEAFFLAVLQILVYAGAVMVLFFS